MNLMRKNKAMKAKELAEVLLKNPDWKVSLSADVSTCDDDSGNRVHGDEIYEIIHLKNSNEFIICFDGVPNYKL